MSNKLWKSFLVFTLAMPLAFFDYIHTDHVPRKQRRRYQPPVFNLNRDYFTVYTVVQIYHLLDCESFCIRHYYKYCHLITFIRHTDTY